MNKKFRKQMMSGVGSLVVILVVFLFLSSQSVFAGKNTDMPNPFGVNTIQNTDGKHIVSSDGNFSDHDLYQADEADALAKKLGFKKGITAVPRSKAIQQGMYVNGEPVTMFPKPGDNESGFFIEGEYGFIPRWTSGKTTATVYLKKNGKYERVNNNNEAFWRFNSGDDGYVKFTNLGFYKGVPVSIVMRPDPKSLQGNGVNIGLSETPETVEGESSDNASLYMSVSQTGNYLQPPDSAIKGVRQGFNRFGANYVDMDYRYFDSGKDANWNNDLEKNNTSSIKVSGFLTFNDFDFEESIGFNKDIDMHRLYLLQADEADQPMKAPAGKDPYDPYSFKDYPGFKEDDPLGIRHKENAGYHNQGNPYQKYWSQKMYARSDWYSQLGYAVKDGYTYINRGSRDDTDAFRISNWFSFTYGETEKFTLRINASSVKNTTVMSAEGLEFFYSSQYNESKQINGLYPMLQYGENESTVTSKLMFKIFENKGVKLNETEKKLENFHVIHNSSSKRKETFINNDEKQFNEEKFGDQVVFIYRRSNLERTDEFGGGYDRPSYEQIEKNINLYFYDQYKRYLHEKIPNSKEDELLEGIYQTLIKVDKGQEYSIYGLREKNIGYINIPEKTRKGSFKNAGLLNNNKQELGSIAYLLNSPNYDTMPYKDFETYKFSNFLADFMKDDEPGWQTTGINGYRWYTGSKSGVIQVSYRGSTIGFTSDTFIPILFPAPIKEVKKDDSTKNSNQNHEIEWDINQNIPPRIVTNSEQQYTINDAVDKILNVSSVEIYDHGTEVNETSKWTVQIAADKKSFKAFPKATWLSSNDFYNRSISIKLKTTLDKQKLGSLSDAELKEYQFEQNADGENEYLLVPNQATATLSWSGRDENGHSVTSEYTLYSRPKYTGSSDGKGEPTIGRLSLDGVYNLEKVDKKTREKLPNVGFELRREKEDTTPAGVNKKTDRNGRITWNDLKIGDYWLVETDPPAGYRPRAPEKVFVGTNIDYHVIENDKARKIGKLSKPIKSVYNSSGEDIDGKRVSIGDELTYRIYVKNIHPDNDRVLEDVFIRDELESSLTVVKNSTTATIDGETPETLTDADVWKSDMKKLDTSSVKGLSLESGPGKGLTFEFKVKVKDDPAAEIKNFATVSGSGLNDNDQPANDTQDSNTVKNFVFMDIYLRQVVIKDNPNLAKPIGKDRGFFKLKNVNDQKTILSTVHSLAESTMTPADNSFTKVTLIPSSESSKYNASVVMPEMYRYVGYVLTKDKIQSFNETSIHKESASFDLSHEDEKYLSVIIEPTVQTHPMFYNWAYKLNQFDQKIKVVPN